MDYRGRNNLYPTGSVSAISKHPQQNIGTKYALSLIANGNDIRKEDEMKSDI